ncbi:BMP family protein [Quadrisphaera sp. DSM 44207]|uniref:BMP family lipoprotein n=1 Tax=Quadrisphaera sp. DSM 44207 TaxID=1881057 RepID=UPI0008903FAB|nr:BMP family ABC transporter substrate-binding protein [Quadrisphaera sp. DSM 44207]SDQ11945.1 nucleoside-binding protein [Quadrisphaera sp. DSM 44207]
MKKIIGATALAGVVALAAACGEAPEEATGTDAGAGGGETSAAAAEDFTACMVTDAGGADDRSFNQSAYEGLTALEESAGIEVTLLESSSEADYGPNLAQTTSQDCGITVTVGFLLAGATAEAAQANPDQQFALVDSTTEPPLENVKPLLFDTAQASYLAGYLAAGTTRTGTVATFGGVNIPTVTVFMDGFADGVAAYNQARGADVRVLGWDKAAQDGSFTGDFENQANGQALTEQFIQQGADVVMPVAGPVGLGAAAAAQANGSTRVIWVDTDGYESASQYAPLFLSSVVKEIDQAVTDVTTAAVEGEFSADPYVGTLENGGVGLAPYHDFEDDVPQQLKDEIDALRERIASGELVVESPSTPTS